MTTNSMRSAVILFSMSIFAVSGCGYTTRSLMSPHYKTIYVENFTNKIRITEEQSDVRMYRGYRPGMEIDITKDTVDRFLFDGNLKIVNDKNADLILKGELVDFRKEALRYDANNNIEEYRIALVVNLELTDQKSEKAVWTEGGFSGEAVYRTSGSLAKSETTAIRDASKDLARRIVERTVEGW